MDRIQMGGVEITRVVEWRGPVRTVAEIFPDTPSRVWHDNASWLSPDFWDPATSAYQAAVQTWVVRSSGMTVLVDTGIGNDRDRPQTPQFDHLATGFLDRLTAAGVDPGGVDIVVNTHIHYDHVGWNTFLAGGSWEPTFPNATYLVPREDYEYFHPGSTSRMRPPRTEDERRRFEGIGRVFADSIQPIQDAGQLTTWSGCHRLNDALHLRAAPGHTPGSSVLWLAAPRRAVFVGDILHSPVQILRPGDCASFDLDASQARASRRNVLTEAASTGAVIFPAHLRGHSAASITADPATDAFTISTWADFPAH
jgi:glyoxylase-like metal-dependent hydrolase (beta-lactamase superfamily II)